MKHAKVSYGKRGGGASSLAALLAIAAGAATASFGGVGSSAPQVTDVAVAQIRDEDRTVTVEYALSEDAIVTVDFQTNTLPHAAGAWVSIGASNFVSVAGDVNRVVAKTTGSERRRISWPARTDWPDVRIHDGSFQAVVTASSRLDPPDYLVIDLTQKSNCWYFTSADALPWGPITNKIYKDQLLPMRRIRARGRVWLMGSTPIGKSQNSITRTNEDAHRVMLTRDYYIAVYLTTRAQRGLVDGTSYDASLARLPAQATWNKLRGDATTDGNNWPTFLADGTLDYETSHKVSPTSLVASYRSFTGFDGLDLPTEAQWEYACRGTDRTEYVITGERPNDASNLNVAARNNGNKNTADCEGLVNGRATVGSYPANSFGLYDMLGNALEWCLDWFENWATCNDGGPLDTSRVIVDPVGPSTGTSREARGGDYSTGANYMYITLRAFSYAPSTEIGFRLVMDIR